MWCINHIQLPCVNAPRPVTGGPKILREIPGFAYAHVMILTTRRGVEIHKMCVLSFPWSVNLVSLWHWANPKTTVFFFANRAPSKLREDQALIRLYLAVQRCCRRKTPRSRSTNSPKKASRNQRKSMNQKWLEMVFGYVFPWKTWISKSFFERCGCFNCPHPKRNRLPGLSCQVGAAEISRLENGYLFTWLQLDPWYLWMSFYTNFYQTRDIYKPTFFAAATKPFFMTFHEKLVNRDLIVMPH